LRGRTQGMQMQFFLERIFLEKSRKIASPV